MEQGRQFQLFHGARKDFNDTHVRPPSQTGANPVSSRGFSSGSSRPPHTDLAFATPNEHIAWSYARAVPLSKNAPENNDPDPKYRSRVFTVGNAPDEHRDFEGDSEVSSEKGFPITGVHHSEVGATSTFHEINWNAYKSKKGDTFVPSGDRNQSYMDTPLEPPPKPRPEPHKEIPGQLNLYSGHTAEDHEAYENTPGAMLSLNKAQFGADKISEMDKDPYSKVLRRKKYYHERVDVPLGTVH